MITISVPECLKTSTLSSAVDVGKKKKEISQTIRLVVIEEGRVLLVHEKSDEFSTKPSGWGLPGGGLDGNTVQELVEAIFKFLPVYCKVPVDKTQEVFESIMNTTSDIDLSVFLVGVKEGIEETGLIIRPERQLFEKRDAPDHVVVVLSGKIMGGKLITKSTETDDCRWFPLSALPTKLYVSHLGMIKRSVSILGLEDKVSKEDKREEKEDG